MKQPAPQKMYKLEMIFNGLTFKKSTNDLSKTILSLKPDILYTEIYITVKKGDVVSEKKINLVQGRKLFNNSDFLEIFINNLLFNFNG